MAGAGGAFRAAAAGGADHAGRQVSRSVLPDQRHRHPARGVRAEVSGPEELSMRTQAERARAFRALHERPGIFIMPNPWDAGTAKLFASLGFEALATTSLGFSSSLG